MQTLDVKTLGRLLKQERAASGASLRDVTKETGISASTLSRIENGKGDPDFKQVLGLARYLNVSLEVQTRESKNSLEAVREILCADGNLNPEMLPMLMQMVTTAYNICRKPKRNGSHR